MSFSSKKGFTIIEILIITVVLAVGLLSIITVMRQGFAYVQVSRQRVIALNLAREGVEAVYQIRNTNWQRWSSEKDACWLKRNPMVDQDAVDCTNDDRMQSGSYILDTATVNGQRYFLLTGYSSQKLSIANGIDANDLSFRLCVQSGSWYACPGTTDPTTEGVFYREIYGYGLFIKDIAANGGWYANCGSGGAKWLDNASQLQPCGSSRAKEYVFCSRVVYGVSKELSLCGSITNFVPDS